MRRVVALVLSAGIVVGVPLGCAKPVPVIGHIEIWNRTTENLTVRTFAELGGGEGRVGPCSHLRLAGQPLAGFLLHRPNGNVLWTSSGPPAADGPSAYFAVVSIDGLVYASDVAPAFALPGCAGPVG